MLRAKATQEGYRREPGERGDSVILGKGTVGSWFFMAPILGDSEACQPAEGGG